MRTTRFWNNPHQGRIQDFKLGGGAHLKKLRQAEGGAKIFEVFRVKNHDFTPKNTIFSNFRGGARRVRLPPWSRPCSSSMLKIKQFESVWEYENQRAYTEWPKSAMVTYGFFALICFPFLLILSKHHILFF